MNVDGVNVGAAAVDESVARVTDLFDGIKGSGRDAQTLTPAEVNAELIKESTQLSTVKKIMEELNRAYAPLR